MPRWSKDRPVSGTIRRVFHHRQYAPPREAWKLTFYWPPGVLYTNEFATEALAVEYFTEVQADPDRVVRERPRKIRADRARRAADEAVRRAAIATVQPKHNSRAPHRRRSIYRSRPPPVAKLGTIRQRKQRNKSPWVVDWYDKDHHRHASHFASEREARTWRDAKIRELQSLTD